MSIVAFLRLSGLPSRPVLPLGTHLVTFLVGGPSSQLPCLRVILLASKHRHECIGERFRRNRHILPYVAQTRDQALAAGHTSRSERCTLTVCHRVDTLITDRLTGT